MPDLSRPFYKSDIYFVGVFSPDVPGFYVYAPASFYRQRLDHLPEDFPVDPYALDGALLGLPTTDRPGGEAVLLHHLGWTILSFWDDSGTAPERKQFWSALDATSNFVMRGTYTFAQAMEKARAAFPVIWLRFPFEVAEKTSHSDEDPL